MLAKIAQGCCRNAKIILLIIPLHAFAVDQQHSLFSRVTTALETASGEQRARFAEIALKQLADAYLSEARIVYQSHTQIGSDQLQWVRSVEGYAGELGHLRERIEVGEPARIDSQLLTAPMIVVANYRVMLTHPRPDQQLAFEHQVLEQFCQQDRCEDLLANNNNVENSGPSAAADESVRPKWEFSMAGPACAEKGIHISFEYGTNFRQVRALCNSFFKELESLLDALRWQQNHQVLIDWSHLRIDPSTGQSQQVLLINGFGDTVVVSLPLLYEEPKLLSATAPWLKARLANQRYPLRLKAKVQNRNGNEQAFRIEKVGE